MSHVWSSVVVVIAPVRDWDMPFRKTVSVGKAATRLSVQLPTMELKLQIAYRKISQEIDAINSSRGLPKPLAAESYKAYLEAYHRIHYYLKNQESGWEQEPSSEVLQSMLNQGPVLGMDLRRYETRDQHRAATTVTTGTTRRNYPSCM